jgi:hypothetical protein
MERVPLAFISGKPYAGTCWQEHAYGVTVLLHVSAEEPFKGFSADELRLKSLMHVAAHAPPPPGKRVCDD